MTNAQRDCLRLAASDADGVRYFKGGWYSVPAALGSQHQPAIGGAATNPQTIRACVARGWLADNGAADIYARRWTITDAGRAALASGGAA